MHIDILPTKKCFSVTRWISSPRGSYRELYDPPFPSLFGDVRFGLYPSHIELSDPKSSGASWCSGSLGPVKGLSGLAMEFTRLDVALNGSDAIGCNNGAATGWVTGCLGPAGFSFFAMLWTEKIPFIIHVANTNYLDLELACTRPPTQLTHHMRLDAHHNTY